VAEGEPATVAVSEHVEGPLREMEDRLPKTLAAPARARARERKKANARIMGHTQHL
jgi:hypothetical protein